MATLSEMQIWQKRHLLSLLKIKGGLPQATPELTDELKQAVGEMTKEDVAYCEKIIGVQAL